MALNPAALAEAMTQAELAASGAVSPEALQKIRTKNDAIAQAVLAFVVSATVTVTAEVAPGQAVQVVVPAGTGSTITPGVASGFGVIT